MCVVRSGPANCMYLTEGRQLYDTTSWLRVALAWFPARASRLCQNSNIEALVYAVVGRERSCAGA